MLEQAKSQSVELLDPNGPSNSTIFILGATGCGKTTIMANLLKSRPRFVIIDVKEEYPPSFFGPNTVVCVTLQQYVDALNANVPKIILRPAPNLDDESFISYACLQLLDFQRANRGSDVTLGMDEFNRFVSSHSCPKGLYEVMQRGRGLYIRKIFGAQWFNSCPTWARDSFSEIFVFKHNETRGLAMLETYGFNAESVRELPPHSCIHSKGGELTKLKLVPTKSKL